jgi:methenyltetrahydrofolate cyclohydrolase
MTGGHSTEMSSYLETPFEGLLGKFASGEAAPGGGSASALSGALAGALAQMVSRLTIGKKNYEEATPEATAILAQAEALTNRLATAIEGDAASFERVMQAMALPKETDEQKATRRDAMQEAFKGATLAPLGVAQACLEAGKLGARLLAIGNQNASTDAGVAVLLAVAGGEGALFNVAINLGSIKDEAWVAARRAEVAPLWGELRGLRDQLWPALNQAGVEVPTP